MKEGATLGGSATRTANAPTTVIKLVAGKSRMTVRSVPGSSLQLGDIVVTEGMLYRDHKRPRLSLFHETVTEENILDLRARALVYVLVH
jgi:hypothetical protein